MKYREAVRKLEALGCQELRPEAQLQNLKARSHLSK